MTRSDDTLHKAGKSIVRLQEKARYNVPRYLDLDAAGFLMVALGHLVKAMEKLDQEPPSKVQYNAVQYTQTATNFVRLALKLLDEQKEET